MIAHIKTVALKGIEALGVEAQLMTLPGKMGMSIVGLGDKAVAESRERIQAAIHASNLSLPVKKITVNLAPADFPKEGSHYDLAIAIGLLIAMKLLPEEISKRYVVLGELSLDGSILPVQAIIPAALYAQKHGLGLICPYACASQALWAAPDCEIIGARTLLQLLRHFDGSAILPAPSPMEYSGEENYLDLSDIKGQLPAKRALEVAAAGGHNILFVGPPGSGKSMLAQRLPSILPPLDREELLELSLIYSVSGEERFGFIAQRRPFRSPHHGASMAAMIGGGLKARPGEVSLAHNGVLFLDELPEFGPKVLDSLRQPLESGECVVARANHHVRYPAHIQLVAAMNPCKCGLSGEPGHVCARGERCRTDYQARISGPLLDRIDLRILVPAVSFTDLTYEGEEESSQIVAQRVLAAREIQKERYKSLGMERIRTNSACPVSLLEKVAPLDSGSSLLIHQLSEKMRLSARSYHRLLKVARTIADMQQSEKISASHVAEAISYRLSEELQNS